MWERRDRASAWRPRRSSRTRRRPRREKVTHPIPEEFRGIGVRIEDDILITAGGNEVLTAGTPEDHRRGRAHLPRVPPPACSDLGGPEMAPHTPPSVRRALAGTPLAPSSWRRVVRRCNSDKEVRGATDAQGQEGRDPRRRGIRAGRDDRTAQGAAGCRRRHGNHLAGKRRGPGMEPLRRGRLLEVDTAVSEADAADYDALLLPGGVMNPDQLRTNPDAIAFVKRFEDSGKPIAVICHGPWTLIEAGVVKGRKIDVVAVAEDRSDERRRSMGRRGGRGRSRTGVEPQARRHPRIQSEADRGVPEGRHLGEKAA